MNLSTKQWTDGSRWILTELWEAFFFARCTFRCLILTRFFFCLLFYCLGIWIFFLYRVHISHICTVLVHEPTDTRTHTHTLTLYTYQIDVIPIQCALTKSFVALGCCIIQNSVWIKMTERAFYKWPPHTLKRALVSVRIEKKNSQRKF